MSAGAATALSGLILPRSGPETVPSSVSDDDDSPGEHAVDAAVSLSRSTLSRLLADLRRASHSIPNRLRSIRADAAFVAEVRAAFGGRRPLVANERCGSWYVPPREKGASAYFKSTDGHQGQWGFSTRRLNLHLLRVIGENDGCIIVDSTRRGKRMPDALSKTVPIWCAVLNRALFPIPSPSSPTSLLSPSSPVPPTAHELHVPPTAVSASEHHQISLRLSALLASFLALGLDLAPLRAQLRKPLRPLWITQDSRLPDLTPGEAVFDDFHPVVCCTASRSLAGRDGDGGDWGDAAAGEQLSQGWYVQGAGDDTENWACGLTASLFWANEEELMQSTEHDLPELIARLVAEARLKGMDGNDGDEIQRGMTTLAPYPVAVGRLAGPANVDVVNVAVDRPKEETHQQLPCIVRIIPGVTTDQATWLRGPRFIEVGLGRGKTASRNLRKALPTICSFVSSHLAKSGRNGGGQYPTTTAPSAEVLVTCESGRDLSVGVALAVLCWCFAESGEPRLADSIEMPPRFTKDLIRARLGRIMTAMPDANPNRATLQSVNSFLMDWKV